MNFITRIVAAAATSLVLSPAVLADTVVVDFEDGPEGWVGPQGGGGFTVVENSGGNPDAHLHSVFADFGIAFRNSTNPAFAQDFSQYDSVTFSVDMKVESIVFFGAEVTRPWFVEVRDYDNVPAGWPWVSVWYHFDWVGQSDWTTWSVTIDDTSVVDLPAGWRGYGAEDPETFEPILPENRTFADVLAGADELAFSTLEPGWLFGTTEFNVRLDNITVLTQSTVTGDTNGDGVVNINDLVTVLSDWDCKGECPGDVDGDGVVGIGDLLTILSNWTI